MEAIIIVLLICLTVMFVSLGIFITVMWVRYAGSSLKVRESFNNIIDQKDSLINEIINDKILLIDDNAKSKETLELKVNQKNVDLLRVISLNEQYQNISIMDIKEQKKLNKDASKVIDEIVNSNK